MVNIWNAYQCMVTFNMSRSASYFESGIGRGMGFRDSNQDLLGFVHMIPERARERILDISATQLKNGGAFHQYQPLTKRGNNDVGSGFNDDPAWLILGVAAYIKESGDWSILDEQVQYENEDGSEAPLYEHLQRSIQYTLDRLGPNNLPLIGRADWNDCLNLNCFSDTPGQSFQTTTNKDGTVAESVFIAGLFVLTCKEMAGMAKYYVEGDKAAGQRLQVASTFNLQPATFYSSLTIWKKRYGPQAGTAIGSAARMIILVMCLAQRKMPKAVSLSNRRACALWQAWAWKMGMRSKALDSVAEHLATPHGIVLQQPAFSQYYLHLGEISSYPPGYKENAGIFCHTNPWIMIAESMVGRGDKAFDYYKRINPSAREEISELHKCEPYVYAQMIAGKDAPTHGEAKNSWLSGTAAWNYVAITQYVLGIRPSFDGLEIDPAIPASWDGFKVTRKYRDVTYHINVTNPKHICKGVEKVTVNGKQVDGNVIRTEAGTDEVNVEVVMG